ncbi:MAG: hypothetical protein IJ262_09195 [Clostridia bacterium]|nr:hypothetical protein [Clostridia bacterium]
MATPMAASDFGQKFSALPSNNINFSPKANSFPQKTLLNTRSKNRNHRATAVTLRTADEKQDYA